MPLKSIFNNKLVLQSNYNPEMIPHREEQIESVAYSAPALRGESWQFVYYGKTGTGKTLVVSMWAQN